MDRGLANRAANFVSKRRLAKLDRVGRKGESKENRGES
jgi:hypothetical protein